MTEATSKRSLSEWITIYTHRKVLAVCLMGFSSGLPLLLIGGTLGAWLRDAGLDKGTIGTFALVALPYSFNFLWAPFIDRLKLPILSKRFGRRRGWLFFTQAVLLVAIAGFSTLDPAIDTAKVAWLAVLVAFFSASQDVVIDAFRTEYLGRNQYGEGAAMAVFGYRLGMLFTGAGALALADQMAWQIVYAIMALGMLASMIVVLFVKEPESTEAPSKAAPSLGAWLYEAVVMPFRDFATRHAGWWMILLFILFYRMPDGFIGFITTPFFLDIGFTKSQVAAIAKVYGFGATLAGMFAGGVLIHKLGIRSCLWWFLIFQICTNLTYAGLSVIGPEPYYLMFAISMDNLSGGMITAAAIAYMMSLCNQTYTATQYALLSSLASLASKTIAGSAGFVAEAHGWTIMFIASAAFGLPAMLLYWLGPFRNRG
ncbi:MAG: MFS transporter [Rickettsiales bacterium]|nr:MFS transporter [Rickettsiales bacterium]